MLLHQPLLTARSVPLATAVKSHYLTIHSRHDAESLELFPRVQFRWPHTASMPHTASNATRPHTTLSVSSDTTQPGRNIDEVIRGNCLCTCRRMPCCWRGAARRRAPARRAAVQRTSRLAFTWPGAALPAPYHCLAYSALYAQGIDGLNVSANGRMASSWLTNPGGCG